MRLVLLVAFGVAVALAEVKPVVRYHEAIGIPAAARIKAAEDAVVRRAEKVEGTEVRIVGGAIAPTNSHPYLGGLIISLVGVNYNTVCGSSLVTANRLVTAAHCWNDGNHQAWQFVVVLGSQFLFSGGTRITTTNVVVHPQWNVNTLVNDIAVIYLPTNVPFSANIQPIALPSGTQLENNFAGLWGTAAGYGITNDWQTGVSTATQVSQVNVQVITVAQCQATFGWYVQNSNICTNGAGGVGICGGDSGGPLFVTQNGQKVLVGISSFVADLGCELGYPSAFARVTSFYSFIMQNL